jgi:hypothetical protein
MASREQVLGVLVVVCLVMVLVALVAGPIRDAGLERRLDKLEARIERGERVVPRLLATAEAVATECAGIPAGWEPPDASSQEWDRSVAPPMTEGE